MTLHYLLMANQSKLRKLLMQRLSDTGLTIGQPKVLDYLGDHDGASQTEIAAACYIEPASLTSALNGMEAKGLVERRRLDGNRRSYYIFLTDTGKEMSLRVKAAFKELEHDAFAALPTGQEDAMMSGLEAVYEAFNSMLEKAANHV